jgi:hypothetical protein
MSVRLHAISILSLSETGMNGIHNVYQGGSDFVVRNYLPQSTTDAILIGASFTITFFITNYFLRYRVFKWFYIGAMLILVASWYRVGVVDESIHVLETYGFRLQ